MAFVHENTVIHHMLGEDCPCHRERAAEHEVMSACVKCSMAQDELVVNTNNHFHCDMCDAAVLPDQKGVCIWCGFRNRIGTLVLN